MRVHELAKELGKETKEILNILIEKGVEVKSHMSTVSEEDVAYVKSVVSGSSPKKSAEPVKEAKEEPKKEEAQKEEKKADEAEQKPKKKISAVFNPQNSSSSKRFGGRGESRQIFSHKEKINIERGGDNKPKQQQRGPVDVSKAFERALGKDSAPSNKNAQPEREPAQKPVNEQVKREPRGRVFDGPIGGRPLNRDAARPASNDRGQGREQRDNRDNRDNRPGRNDNRQDRNNRPDRNDRNDRNDRGFSKDRFDNNKKSAQPAPDVNNNKKSDSRNFTKNQYASKKDKSKDRLDEQENSKLKKSDITKNKPEVKQEEEIKVITIPETLTIKDLADKLKLQPSALVKKLFLQGKVVTINQEIDFETAEEIALEYDVISEKEVKIDMIEEILKEEEEDPATLKSRPPVVCVMGHVDHGKTSLLDAIRETNVTSHEHGGITQHIGAYTVEKNGEKITFLDTPGHEAFTAMRMRGAQSTDIAILVVAADDGVMPQTVEAINHAKAADIPIIVAVNKIDKPSANVDKVKQELSEHELIPEDWGGTTIFVPVSAHTKEGIDDLLDMVLLSAEMCELKANPNRKARGLVLEAKLDKGKGSVANVLVQKGTLKVGDAIAAGEAYGRVRAMMDDKGRRIKAAGPSTPVEILGLNGVPNAGETFVVKDNEKEARSFASVFVADSKEKLIEGTKKKLSLDGVFDQIQAGEIKELDLVVKADVQGSVEAIKQSLVKLSNDEVVVKIIHSGVGAINESDVLLASASNAIIIGFNVKPDNQAHSVAESEGVDVRLYSVIYNAIEDVEAAMKGLLDPVYEEKVIGHAEIRQTFKASGVGTIAGSYVLDGLFKRDCKARITREDEQIFDGPVASLKRFKDDVKEVKAGYECGLVFEDFNDIREGDLVEAYEMVEVPR